MLGTTILHYRIESKLGEGGMGEVFLAFDTQLERRVALKFLTQRTSTDPLARTRLIREAKSASALNHPNILTIHSVEDSPTHPFIVMEYIEGQTLADLLTATTPLPLPRILDLATQISAALTVAHEHSIVHRDLKPANVIVNKRGQAKIMDFGLAKSATQPALTQSGSTVGTLAYMSPEQVRGDAVDSRSDVFSFGALLYELTTGRSPFHKEGDIAAVLHAILNETPTPIQRVRPGTPAELTRIIDKCLQKDRTRRYESTAELASDLSKLSQAYASGTLQALADERKRGLHRIWPWLAAAALLGIVSLAWRPWRASEPAPTTQVAAPAPPTPRGPFVVDQERISFAEGSPSQPSLNPEGTLVAFVDTKAGVPQLFVKDLAGAKPVQLTSGNRAIVRPRWSPSGNRIAYHEALDAGNATRGMIYTISPLGGQAHALTEGTHPSWSFDGGTIVFERNAEIWLVAADGTNARQVAGLPPPFRGVPRTPALSPDGKEIVFFQPQLGPLGQIMIGAVDGSGTRVLAEELDLARDPVWTPDGKHVIYSSVRNETRNLWRVAVAGGEPEPLTRGVGDDVQPSLSRDGKKLAYINQRLEHVLKIWQPTSKTERTLLSSRNGMMHPGISPDGKRIVAFGGMGPGTQILTVDIATGEITELTPRTEVTLFPEWSGDGRFIYYFHTGADGDSYRRVSASGQGSEVVFAGWGVSTRPFPAMDPSEKRVMSMQLAGMDIPKGSIVDVATRAETSMKWPLYRPAWSKDGTRVVAEGPPGTLVLYEVASGDGSALCAGQAPRWSEDDQSVLFLRPRDGEWELWKRPLDSKTETKLHDLGPMFEQAQRFDVGPRGEIVWCRYDRGSAELWCLELE